jgi:hypothetical protein
LLRYFGWRRCALLYYNDRWGAAMAADVVANAGSLGIVMLATQNFESGSVPAVRDAVSLLRGSGARIFVYLDDTGKSLANVLLAAEEAGLTGDGFAWVGYEMGDLELALQSSGASVAHLRSLLFGWLNLWSASPPQVRFHPCRGLVRAQWSFFSQPSSDPALNDRFISSREHSLELMRQPCTTRWSITWRQT